MRQGSSPSDTIAAVATPAGTGGIAVIRISGTRALTIADAIFRPSGTRSGTLSAAPSHTVHHGHVDRDGVRIDEVLATVLKAPRPFTRPPLTKQPLQGFSPTGKASPVWELGREVPLFLRLGGPADGRKSVTGDSYAKDMTTEQRRTR